MALTWWRSLPVRMVQLYYGVEEAIGRAGTGAAEEGDKRQSVQGEGGGGAA